MLRKSSESPELKTTEAEEDWRMQVRQCLTSVEMDYILVTEEENTPSAKDILERNKTDFAFLEANVAEQIESCKGFSPGSSDTFQPISITNEREGHTICGTEWDSVHLEEKSSVVPQNLDDEGSQESCGQDEGWIMLSQNEVSDVLPEEISAESKMSESESGRSGKEPKSVSAQELMHDTRAKFQVETAFQKSSEYESCSPSDSLTVVDESSGIEGPRVLKAVHCDAWEESSQQGLVNNVATEQEIKEEKVLLNNAEEMSQKSR